MSEIAIGGRAPRDLFRGRTVALMLAVGIIAFLATVVLGAFAPDLRSGRNGGAHALSNGATGYAALLELARATGREPRIVRDPSLFDAEDLLVLTPERADVDISDALNDREVRPTLFVLPKWETVADKERSGWVRGTGNMLPISEPIGVLAPWVRFEMKRYGTSKDLLIPKGIPSNIRPRQPRAAQVITGMTAIPDEDGEIATFRPLLVDRQGGVVLAQLGEEPLFVLADPDLLNNMGMGDLDQAAAALALLDWLNTNPPDSFAFDVSFNGLGATRSPLKLMLEPPFLALTLGIVVALVLAGWQALARFGPVARPERAVALGKTALVDNSAALLRKAGRELKMGGRYAAVVRERAARAFGAPPRLRGEGLDAYLDALGGKTRFTELVMQAESIGSRKELAAAAQALHDWQDEKMGDHK